jgi:hypothetical protein
MQSRMVGLAGAMVLFAALCAWSPAALAYFAPFQNVTGPTSVLDPATGHRLVTFSVVNPANGQTSSHSEDLGPDSKVISLNSLTLNGGIIVWGGAFSRTNTGL